jgi:hypothetical protein
MADARQGQYDEHGGVFTQDTPGAGVVGYKKRKLEVEKEKAPGYYALFI